jgi:hypothetical protein
MVGCIGNRPQGLAPTAIGDVVFTITDVICKIGDAILS